MGLSPEAEDPSPKSHEYVRASPSESLAATVNETGSPACAGLGSAASEEAIVIVRPDARAAVARTSVALLRTAAGLSGAYDISESMSGSAENARLPSTAIDAMVRR